MAEINLKKIIKTVNKREPRVAAEVIRELTNECLEILPMYISQTDTVSASGDGKTYNIGRNVLTVDQVYLNDELLPIIATREEFEEGYYNANDYCHIGGDRKIYFPASLAASDTIKLVVNKTGDTFDSLSKSASAGLPTYYTHLIAFYVLKETYLTDEFLDYDKHIVYERKYKTMMNKTKSIHPKRARIDFGKTL